MGQRHGRREHPAPRGPQLHLLAERVVTDEEKFGALCREILGEAI